MAPCSVKHGNLQYCFECTEYPCKHYDGFDSYDTLVLHRNQRKDMQKAKEIGMDAYHAEQRENMFLSTKIRGGIIPPLRWIAEIIRVFRFLCRLHRQ